MTDRELFDQMAEASKRAVEQAMAAGHSRSSKVAKDSGRRAAEEVYLAARGEHVAAEPRLVDEAVPARAEAPAVPNAPVRPPVEDPWQERADLS